MNSDYYNVRVAVETNEDLDGKKIVKFSVSATKELDENDAEYDYEDSGHYEIHYTGYIPVHTVEWEAEELADLLIETADEEFEDLGECYTSEITYKDGEDISDDLSMTVYKGDYWNPDDCEYEGTPEVDLECVLEIKEL